MAEKKNFRVKTFTSELKIFAAMRELATLDEQVNKFLKEKKVSHRAAEYTEKEITNIIKKLRFYLCVLCGLCEIYIFGCGCAAL